MTKNTKIQNIFYRFNVFVIILLLSSCNMNQDNTSNDRFKQEVADTEKAFEQMVQEKGLGEAFLLYAAEDAVLSRNSTLYKGKDEIRAYFAELTSTDIQLKWTPDFIDVSGDLAYTYGQYVFSAINQDGERVESTGIFHTVWKRQADGSWRYVWD